MTSFAKSMDGRALELRCRLNGEEVQRGNRRDLIFPVATLIAFISRCTTLEPGDRLRLESERIDVLEHTIA